MMQRALPSEAVSQSLYLAGVDRLLRDSTRIHTGPVSLCTGRVRLPGRES